MSEMILRLTVNEGPNEVCDVNKREKNAVVATGGMKSVTLVRRFRWSGERALVF